MHFYNYVGWKKYDIHVKYRPLKLYIVQVGLSLLSFIKENTNRKQIHSCHLTSIIHTYTKTRNNLRIIRVSKSGSDIHTQFGVGCPGHRVGEVKLGTAHSPVVTNKNRIFVSKIQNTSSVQQQANIFYLMGLHLVALVNLELT